MSTFISRMDNKGRLVVPKQVRDREELEDGDLFFVEEDSEAGTITFTRMENLVRKRIAEGEAEYRAGMTKSLDEVAAELDIDFRRG